MSDRNGVSVRLFLVDGTTSGLVTAEVVSWTGHVLSGARSGLANLLARPEIDRTGVYFISGRDPDDPDTAVVYVGESENVRKRLKQHNQQGSKDFWERTCVVTSKDQNITKAHARYLESRLIAIAREVGRARLDNTNAPPPVALPEGDRSDMESFIAQIRLVLPVLGFDFLRNQPRARGKKGEHIIVGPGASPVFEIVSDNLGLNAQAQEIDGEFVVFEGSVGVGSWKPQNKNHGYAKLFEKLIDQKVLVTEPESGLARFVKDTPFSSPSAASAVIYGRQDNGRTSWKVKDQNLTYGEWQQMQVSTIAQASAGGPLILRPPHQGARPAVEPVASGGMACTSQRPHFTISCSAPRGWPWTHSKTRRSVIQSTPARDESRSRHSQGADLRRGTAHCRE